MKGPQVTIVSGLPRSGTSMMMRMLEASGLTILTDNRRDPDDDNPNGYYELEQVKGLAEGKADWVDTAKGKVVKVVSPLLPYLPEDVGYRVVVMRRDLDEVLASQRKMLQNRGEPVRDMDDTKLAELYESNLHEVQAWAHRSSNVELAVVDYNELLDNPAPALQTLCQLLGPEADIHAMAQVVDPALYRNRKGTDR